jgi:hypothetical protein
VKTRIAFSVTALVLIAVLAPAGGVAAPTAEPSARTIGNVKINKDGSATVKAQYRCPSGSDWHLWVSVKQTADGSRDERITQEGAGFEHRAATWAQSHPTGFRCDGKLRTQDFRVDTSAPGYGKLVKGDGWVQFCLISEAGGQFLIDQHWSKVRG